MTAARFEFVALVVVLLMLFGARYGRDSAFLTSGQRFLDGAVAPLVLGGLSIAAVWWVWGSLSPPPLISDEISYLLQAKLFASGQWSAPSPPLPEFFEQEHVILVPTFASKYPPGHALLLSPGALLGMPALVPLLLTGLTGSLVFQLARQVSNGWVAILTWLVWVSASGNLIFRASYFSEVTTSALWMAGWWAALAWTKSRRLSLLVILAALVGWGAITRPLTMLAFAVPVGCLILHKMWTSRRLGHAVAPLIVVVAALAIVPLWSSQTTGNWRRTPLGIYTESYMPWDVPGFGLVREAATRESPPDARQKWDGFMERHRNHQVSRLPAIGRERMEALGAELFGGWRVWLVPAALVGIFVLNGAGWTALVCGLTLFAAYLVYAHPPGWVVYYMELFPIPAFLVALGLWKIAQLLAVRVPPYSRANQQPSIRANVAVLLLLPLFASFVIVDTAVARKWWERRAAHRREFESRVSAVPDSMSVVFVRHSPSHNYFTGHVENYADLGKGRRWLVHDRGEENARLYELAPDRSFYLFDEGEDSLVQIRGGSASLTAPATEGTPR